MTLRGIVRDLSKHDVQVAFVLRQDEGKGDVRVETSDPVAQSLKNGSRVALNGQPNTDPPFVPTSITLVGTKSLPWLIISLSAAVVLLLVALIASTGKQPTPVPTQTAPMVTSPPKTLIKPAHTEVLPPRQVMEVPPKQVMEAPPNPCNAGLVPRRARPSDNTCVTPAVAAATYRDNVDAPKYWVHGAFGPQTCVQGRIWRNYWPGDLVCIVP